MLSICKIFLRNLQPWTGAEDEAPGGCGPEGRPSELVVAARSYSGGSGCGRALGVRRDAKA
ncbi:hypothetical protein CRG98_005611 [Punica granatum]|uniref:Uncharacterized protein n=1 Tax=Punica granatum TaxID=22663 RepID=A0A2I0KZU1_PUNGR|nr:hypothetical protein CRG98_005611 [Punica granatum]